MMIDVSGGQLRTMSFLPGLCPKNKNEAIDGEYT